MKSRLLWLAILVAAGVAFYFATIQPTMTPTKPRINRRMINELRPPEIPPPPMPEPTVPTVHIPPPALPPMAAPPRPTPRPANQPEVPFQPGATIDFSTGAPVVRSAGEDKAAVDRAMKDILEATKDLKFDPPKKQEP